VLDSAFSQQISDDEDDDDDDDDDDGKASSAPVTSQGTAPPSTGTPLCPRAHVSCTTAPEALSDTFIALYDFDKTDEDEVSFKVCLCA
jgi:hypothetical protein